MERVQQIIEDIVGRGALVKIGQAGLGNPTGREHIVIIVEPDGVEHRARRAFLWDALIYANNNSPGKSSRDIAPGLPAPESVNEKLMAALVDIRQWVSQYVDGTGAEFEEAVAKMDAALALAGKGGAA